jgi:hypothetical protein
MLVDCVSHIVDSYPVTCPTGRYIRTAPLVHAGYGAHVITWVASAPPACVFFRRSHLFLFVRRGFRTLDASDIPFVYGVYGNLQGVIASTPRLFYTTAGHFFLPKCVDFRATATRCIGGPSGFLLGPSATTALLPCLV